MSASGHLSLLVVDDSPEDRFVARMFLSDSDLANCIVHEADTGMAGIDAMRRLRPDCVLLDNRLPDMSGFEVLDHIRDASGDASFAIVMLTGSGDEAIASAAMHAGAQDYLPKDLINEKSLPLTIRNAISRFDLVRSRREHEQKLRLFIDRAPVAVAMFDREMRFLQASRRYVQDMVSGHAEPGDLAGRGVYDVIPDLPAQWRSAHRDVLDGKSLSVDEDCFCRADGRIDWWRWEMTPWHEADGAVGGVLHFAERINARREAEDALRISEERLRISQEAGAIGCWDWDIATGGVYWSIQQYKLFGLDPDHEGPITHDRWLMVVHPEDLARVSQEISAALASPSSKAMTVLYRIVLPSSTDGAERWIHAQAETKRDPQGLPVRMLGISMDITERRQAEMTLSRLAEDLEKRVAEEVAARQEAQARLVQTQRMEALGQLAGGIAHDFNNVLQAVSGAISLIQRRSDDVEAVSRFSAMAADAAARGASITGRLLSFSRSGSLKSEPIPPQALLEGQREILFHTLGRFIRIEVDADPALPPLLADKAQLETVLVNLAVNARDAMPDGGKLMLRAHVTQVLEGSAHPADLRPGTYVAISVADTGVGMSDLTLARASEPFFTTKPVGKGTGLGLAMARGFAQQSGGGFSIASTVGVGTTVTLWFPAAGETAAQIDNDMVSPAVSTGTRILVVDDDALVGDVVAAFLGDEGYHVTQAVDGFEALKCLDGGEVFGLLITDFAMPGMNGLVLIEEARLRQPQLPVLLLTGFVDAGVQVNIDRQLHDITGILRKPFTGAELVERVAGLLQQQAGLNTAAVSAEEGQAAGLPSQKEFSGDEGG